MIINFNYLFNKTYKNILIGVIIVGLLTTLGVKIIYPNHAQTPSVLYKASNGNLSQGAYIQSDVTAPEGTSAKFGSNLYWMINDGELNNVINAGLQTNLLNYFFNNDHTLLITGSGPNIDNQLPHALKIKKYASEAAIAADAKNGFPAGINYIAYDGETWSFTPQIEQTCPIDYAALAENIVHSKKLGFIYTPGTDLALSINNSSGCQTILGTGTSYKIPGSAAKYPDFLNENFAGLAAPHTDILEVQAQQLQSDSVGFNYFSSNTVDQANLATNKKVPVLIGLTTDDAQQTMTLQQLLDSYNNTKSYADGYWLNIPSTGIPNPALAVSFLQAVYKLQGN